MPRLFPLVLPQRIGLHQLIGLSLLTAGVYHAAWAYRRSSEFNACGPDERLSLVPPALLIAISIATLPLVFIEGSRGIHAALSLLNLSYIFIGFWVALGMRRKLIALGWPTSIGLTFLFGFFYIQHEINQMHKTATRAESIDQSAVS
jgi:hypothetical protein